MKYQVILILIVTFWFLESITLTAISNDEVLQQNFQEEYNYSLINSSASFINLSSDNPSATKKGFLSITLRMFAFRLPEEIFPLFLDYTIKFINYMLLMLLIISIYRIANPLS
jgi:hypothetical protein